MRGEGGRSRMVGKKRIIILEKIWMRSHILKEINTKELIRMGTPAIRIMHLERGIMDSGGGRAFRMATIG
jgi:hypothetical protein